jgi:hypothetical protein
MYVGRKRGVGAVVPVPMSSWGFISPCSIAAAQDAASSGSSASSSSSLVTWGWVAALGILIYATTGGGK